MYIGLHVQYRLLLWSDLNKNFNFLQQIFEKYSNIKFHQNPSSGSQSCSKRTDGRTDRHDEVNSRLFAILRTRLKANKTAAIDSVLT
jgi:hypothetical protein